MKYAKDEDLRAVDLNKLICEHKKAVGQVETKALAAIKYVESEN